MNRRTFVKTSALAGAGFLGLRDYLSANPASRVIQPYGPLIPDPKGILDLPKGFAYRVISRAGEMMSDGFRLPGRPDGMAAFPGKNGRIILVRNHELQHNWPHMGPFHKAKAPDAITRQLAYDIPAGKTPPHNGGTTNLVYNPKTHRVEKQFLSLIGTDRNCAGGAMPWGSWITCEEPEDRTSPRGRKHGYCFEVRATDDGKLQQATPLKALGRFIHEAVALDPETGILYLTEDISNGLLYRFVPNRPRNFHSGKLQALAYVDQAKADTRNYSKRANNLKQGDQVKVKWITLDNVEAPRDDLRHRGHRSGAALFARGEGIIYENGKIYICCTNGGPGRQGQIFALTPSRKAKQPDTLELFLQPDKSDLLTNADNLCAAPWGDLVICEDLVQEHLGKKTHLRGVTPEGKIYTIARNAKNATEFAGSCFSPDGDILFVNMQMLGLTIAIKGPWQGSKS